MNKAGTRNHSGCFFAWNAAADGTKKRASRRPERLWIRLSSREIQSFPDCSRKVSPGGTPGSTAGRMPAATGAASCRLKDGARMIGQLSGWKSDLHFQTRY